MVVRYSMNKLMLAAFFASIVFASYMAYSTSVISNAPRIHIKDSNSLNWAGYAVETSLSSPQSGAVSDVKGSWAVPAVNCSVTPSSYSAFWVGIDGYSSGTVEQTGTSSDCSSGTPKYYAWYEMYPKFPLNLKLAVSPGDRISAEVNYKGNGFFVLTIKDLTKGTSYSTTQRSNNAARSSAEWIAEAPSSSSGVLPLSDFGNVQFTNASATLNGRTGAISGSGWQRDQINMTASSGAVKAATSALGSTGGDFSVAWKSS